MVFFCARDAKFANMNKTLSERELEILRQVAQGLTSPQIAERLSLSAETIKWYRKRLLSKCGAENTAEMIKLAIENKLI